MLKLSFVLLQLSVWPSVFWLVDMLLPSPAQSVAWTVEAANGAPHTGGSLSAQRTKRVDVTSLANTISMISLYRRGLLAWLCETYTVTAKPTPWQFWLPVLDQTQLRTPTGISSSYLSKIVYALTAIKGLKLRETVPCWKLDDWLWFDDVLFRERFRWMVDTLGGPIFLNWATRPPK